MKKNIIIAIKYCVNRKPLFVIAAIFIAYIIFSGILVNRYIYLILKGHNYYYYQLYMMSILFLLTYFVLLKKNISNGYLSFVFGIIIGYLAGICGYTILVLSMPDGVEKLMNALTDTQRIKNFLFTPILTFSWLFGGIVALIIHYGNNKQLNKQDTRLKKTP